jgi:DNA-damage-inducible protein J
MERRNLQTTIQIRTSPEIKAQADLIFKQMGITLSDGLNMFLRQVVMRRGMPFTPEVVDPKTVISTEPVNVGIPAKDGGKMSDAS